MALLNKDQIRYRNQIIDTEHPLYASDQDEPWDFYTDSSQDIGAAVQPNLGFEIFNPAKQLPITYLDPLPAYSAVVGVCLDGLPLLLDLTNPTPGSILVVGEEPSSRTKIMNGLMTSICLINRVDQVQIDMISSQPGNYSAVYDFINCRNNLSSYDRKSAELIIHATALAEQRKSGRQLGPMIVIGIDNVSEFIKNDAFEVKNHLLWLLQHGPKNGVWPVVSIDPYSIRDQDMNLITSFKTQIFANDPLRNLPVSNLLIDQSEVRAEYFTSMGGRRIGFWVPVWQSS